MGADLYIKSLRKECEDQWKPAFDEAVKRRDEIPNDPEFQDKRQKAQDAVMDAYEKMYSRGYFRDSYNFTCVLNRLFSQDYPDGLSYWRDLEKFTNNEGNLEGENLKKFRDLVESSAIREVTEEELKSEGCEEGVAEWTEYFTKKKTTLVAFFDEAITRGEPVVCSV